MSSLNPVLRIRDQFLDYMKPGLDQRANWTKSGNM